MLVCAIITEYPQIGLVWNVYSMKKLILRIVSAMVLVFGITFASALSPLTAYAEEENEIILDGATDDAPENTETTEPSTESPENSENTEDSENPTPPDQDSSDEAEITPTTSGDSICNAETNSVAWILCPVMEVGGNLVSSFYEFIENFLVVKPISTDENSSLVQVWRVMRNITNIVFIIFLIIVIISQLTGVGINNYGIKKILPRLIIAIILVNLSFIISSILVDVSNIVGSGITGLLGGIQDQVMANTNLNYNLDVLWSDFTRAMVAGGAVIGIGVAAAAGSQAIFWGLVLALIGAVISLAIGLITISLRQGLILILIMISPLAFIAYLLPNTEKWFEKWKNLFFQMLFFYPMFSFLFGASKLAGWAIIGTAEGSLFTVLIGMIVQVMPIFFSFSLFKMSGNILGNVNAALQKLSTPVRAGAAGWATSHQELARQKYISSSIMPGAHLRRFLDNRKKGRDLDTAVATKYRDDRATERALNRLASYRGTDAEGNDVYGGLIKGIANSHTRLHKRAALQATLAANAQKNLENNLSEYGEIFHNRSVKGVSDAHAQAFLNSMKQQFRAENIAQGDQNYLLNSYLNAQTNQANSPYEYNRLIKGANGGIGHIGEASIMGQVIVRSAEIEGRRRREALIMKNKFNLNKPEFRGMVFDKAHINDNGYETDANGNVIEDSQYRLLPGKRRQNWQQYIGVHNTTGAEITREEYDTLSAADRKQYKKVRYMEIKDDNNNIVQRVYEDDSGYMKELLINDINIGDPINRRYNVSYGLAHTSDEATGILRRYHSTISAAMLDSNYKTHAAEVTPMITSQANLGYITSIGQYNIANLQSLAVASKAGPFLQNDAYAIKDWANLIACVASKEPGQTFEDYFPDIAIDNYRNVNGESLGGYRKAYDADGNLYWQEINYKDPTLTLEDKRNLVKHKIIPKAARKLIGMLNRDITPGVLENQKPDTLVALQQLLGALSVAGIQNVDKNTPFDDRLDPTGNLFDSQDARILKRTISDTQQAIDLVNQQEANANEMIDRVRTRDAKRHSGAGGNVNDVLNALNSLGDDQNDNHQKSGKTKNKSNLSDNEYAALKSLAQLINRLERGNESESYTEQASDIDHVMGNLDSFFAIHKDNIDSLSSSILDYCQGNPFLNECYSEIEDIVGNHHYGALTDNKTEEDRIHELYEELSAFVYAYSSKKE